MTRRYRESKTSASRRALLPIVGAIPLAMAVTCSSATGDAAARPSVPAPAPFEQLRTSPVQPHLTPRAIDTSAAQGPGRVQYGLTAPVLAPHAELTRAINRQNLHTPEPVGVGAFRIPVPNGVPDTMLDQAKDTAAATNAAIGGGLHPVPVDTSYPDRVTGLTVDGGTIGLVIGAAVGGIPAALFAAAPGAIIGGAIGAIAGGIMGGIAMSIPTLGMGAPLGAAGGALAGAGIGAVIGAVGAGATAGVLTGIIGAAVGYELGAATGAGIGIQG